MRHRVKAQHFNSDTKSRKAMFKNLLSALFEHGAVETTEQKAKAIKRLADKIIGKALPGTLSARRILERFFGSKQTVNRLVDGVVPVMKDRTSGFTRIIRLGRRRGDDASMVKLELVVAPKDKVAEKKTETKKVAAEAANEAPVATEEATVEKAVKKPAKKAAAKAPAAKK
jgi:large subunit ribosomal protein L17